MGDADKLRQYAWFADNAEQKTHPVGQKKPNRLGIFDLYGNVSEWCEDVYSPTYYKESPAVDPHGPANPGKDVKRVIRGGSWKSSADLPGDRPSGGKDRRHRRLFFDGLLRLSVCAAGHARGHEGVAGNAQTSKARAGR